MSSSRVQPPPVNLKERIAALQQRTGTNAPATQRSVSLTTSQTLSPTNTQIPTSSALREKIARFEKKGGTPVPRGSFGLGAPPPTDGHPRRQNELYGNRIPQPVRVVSGGSSIPQRRRDLVNGGPGTGSTGADKRRSVSLSNVNVTADDGDESQTNTPLTSPVLSSPPESPRVSTYDTTTSVVDLIPNNVVVTTPLLSFTTVLESAEVVEPTLHQDTLTPITADVPEVIDEIGTSAAPIVPPEIVISVEEESGNPTEDTEPAELPSVEEEEDTQEVVTQETELLAPANEEEEEAPATDAVRDESNPSSESRDTSASPSQGEEGSIPDASPVEESLPVDTQEPVQPPPSEPVVALSPATSIPSVPSPHKSLLRAAGLGSPPTDTSEPTPSIQAIVLSDDEGAVISPVMAISSPPSAPPEAQLSLSSVLAQVAQEPVDDPEPVTRQEATESEPRARKGPPPALSLDGVALPSSPAPSSSALASSLLEHSGPESSLPAEVQEDPKVDEVNDTEVVPTAREEEVEVVEAASAEEDQVIQVPSMPSSPTTPHAPQFSFPPNPQLVSSSISLRPLPQPPVRGDTNAAVRPVTMFELSPSLSLDETDFAQRVMPSVNLDVPMLPPSVGSDSTSLQKSNSMDSPPTPPEKDFAPEHHARGTLVHHETRDQQQQEEEEEGEPGSVTILPQRAHINKNPTSTSSTSTSRQPSFKAVVHHKVREVAPMPSTPHHIRRALSANNVTASGTSVVPPSPGFTDLAVLLQSTVLLEQTLEQGKLPTESNTAKDNNDDDDSTHEATIQREDSVQIHRLSREEAEESRRTLVKLQAKREEQAKSKIRSTFRNTFARAKAVATNATVSMYAEDGAGAGVERFGSTATLTSENHGFGGDGAQHGQQQQQQQQQQQYYTKRFKSPSVPYLLDSVNENGANSVIGLRPKTPEKEVGLGKPASLASNKSPKSRFPSFRRLGSKSSSSPKDGYGGLVLHGHTRNSVSTSSEISSEDSMPAAVTPPDGEFGEAGKGVGLVSWPSTSPSRKGGKEGREGSGIGRAATFAGKIWQRARTKSGASTLSVHSSSGRLSSEPPPALPPLPNIILPLDDSGDSDGMVQPPLRSTSLKPLSGPFPPLHSKSPDISLSLSLDLEDRSRSPTPQAVTRSSSLAPDSPSSSYAAQKRRRMDNGSQNPGVARPMSWVSVSSSGSNFNSSVLDSELFDAFPSVPENHPLVFPSSQSYSTPQSPSSPTAFLPSPQRDQSGMGLMQSFDSSLLSSAAHLHGEQGGGEFLTVNTGSSGSGFLPLASPWSPPESAHTVNVPHVNGAAKAWNGIPPSLR